MLNPYIIAQWQCVLFSCRRQWRQCQWQWATLLHSCIPSAQNQWMRTTRHINRHYCSAHRRIQIRNSIFAVASGSGKCGVAVIRVSGPATKGALMTLGRFATLPRARVSVLRRLYDPSSGEVLDRGIVIWFPGPHSFTGEDSCELHVHGGAAVVKATLRVLSECQGLRLAEAGEFAKRAFQNGKLDLAEVEGLADLIDSQTEQQRRHALRQLDGDARRLYADWKSRILKCTASLEASIDFGEEDELDEHALMTEVQEDVDALTDEIAGHLVDKRKGERLRNGIHVAIIGEPNVGKSSLLNLLCRRPAAIVSPIAGTTRDVLEVALDIGGYPVVVSDTAGLRESFADPVEREGVKRAVERSSSADLLLLVFDASRLSDSDDDLRVIVSDCLRQFRLRQDEEGNCPDANFDDVIVVFNKSDLIAPLRLDSIQSIGGDVTCCHLSCKTEDGIARVLASLEDKLKNLCVPSDADAMTSGHHRVHLAAVVASLRHAAGCRDAELASRSLRTALRHLGRLAGGVATDEILDVVFARFCIGK